MAMTFSVSSASLLQTLNVVNGAVPTKSAIPILENILFEIDNGNLKLSATDLEISIIQHLPVTFDANVSTEKRIAVPAKRLTDTLRALPDLPITFACTDEFEITLTTDQGHYKMVGHDGADYPALPTLEDGIQILTDAQLVKHAIQKTGFAVSKDALRPAMQGIYFEIGPDGGRAVATDGHQLVKLSLEDLTHAEDISFILPEKALSVAAKIAVEGECSIKITKGYIGFDFGQTKLLARMIDESYPNYEAVIPRENNLKMTINADSMLAAIKRVALYSSASTSQIKLSIGVNKVTLSAEDLDKNSAAKEVVHCEYDGEPLEIGFKSAFLAEALNNVDSADVVLSFSSPNRAGIVTPLEQTAGEEILMLIMPLMLNTYA